MALILAALMIHGINPGPTIMTQQPEMFWALLVSMVIGNLILLVLNIPMVGIWVRLLSIPYRYLYPPIVLFIVIGVYSLNNNPFDVVLTAIFGVVGYIFKKLNCEPALMLLGFILGPMMEENFRRAMILSRGDPTTFVTRPISLVFLALALLFIALIAASAVRAKRRQLRA
jgi:TctA family transporter